jgi:hypothetical protein
MSVCEHRTADMHIHDFEYNFCRRITAAVDGVKSVIGCRPYALAASIFRYTFLLEAE